MNPGRYFAITKDRHVLELVPITMAHMDELRRPDKTTVCGFPVYIADDMRLYPLPSEEFTIVREIDPPYLAPHAPKEVQSCPILNYPHVCCGGTPIVHDTALSAYRRGRSDEANGF